jgi:hypothetical protein
MPKESRMRATVLLTMLLCTGPVWAEGFRLVEKEGRFAEYDGRLALDGHFERRQDAETLVWRGDRVCFHPDAAGVARLPAKPGVRSEVRYFCFANHHAATEKFQLATVPPAGSCGMVGKARVVISHYTVETDSAFDQAVLDSVEKLDGKTPLACP